MPDSKDRITVPMEVNWTPSWLTWITSVKGCLNALGVKCGPADVAGATGYAFYLGIHPTLCPSGPFVCNHGTGTVPVPPDITTAIHHIAHIRNK